MTGTMSTRALAELRALTDVSGIGNKRAAALYQQFGSVKRMVNGSLDDFNEFHYIDANAFAAIQELDDRIETYRQRFDDLRQSDISVIGIEDSRYPESLRESHTPVLLYARGNVSLLSQPAVTFSGSRETDARGCKWARETAMNLADSYVVVSGGAAGVDTAAHRGALDGDGDTIAVYGTGLQSPYPEENEQLFEEIVAAGGLLVSERPPDAGPNRHGFLQRNKTNSALGEGVVIPAAGESSGTMSQFSDARRQDRPVFVPDSAFEFTPNGGIAQMRKHEEVTTVIGADDILEELAKQKDESRADQQASLDDW